MVEAYSTTRIGKRDMRGLGNYIHKLKSKGKTDKAYKIARQQLKANTQFEYTIQTRG